MNVTSLRTNADANAASAEIRIAKVALCNIALWAAMWTPYAAIVLQVLGCFWTIQTSQSYPSLCLIQGLLGDQSSITPLITILPALIAKSASICNPVVYAISHPKFRVVIN